jgi:hypothetical protein
MEVEFVRLCTGDNVVCWWTFQGQLHLVHRNPLLINLPNRWHARVGRGFNPQKSVENVLELTGIPLIIPIYPDLALRKLQYSNRLDITGIPPMIPIETLISSQQTRIIR